MTHRLRNKRGSLKNSNANKLRLPSKAKDLSVKSEPFLQINGWPGNIDNKQIEDVRNRLNLMAKTHTSTHMIESYLAGHNSKSRDAVEAIHETTEFRKGHQMFFNNYRTCHPRHRLLDGVKKCGTGPSSTYGHTKHGRIVFYECVGETFNQALHKEFTTAEFMDHVIVWCEKLLQMALANYQPANAERDQHMQDNYIQYIPYYANESEHAFDTNENDSKMSDDMADIPITPQFDDEYSARASLSGLQNQYKFKIEKPESGTCIYSDVIGIIDWKGCNPEKFLANKHLIFAADRIISKHFPHLMNKILHVNMPLDFALVEENDDIRKGISHQTLTKSIYLETEEMLEQRESFMKEKIKEQKRMNRRSNRLTKNKAGKIINVEEELIKAQKEKQANIDRNGLHEDIKQQLLDIISGDQLPHAYGGQVQDRKVFKKFNPFLCSIIGLSSEPDMDAFADIPALFADEWHNVPLKRSERHTERVEVKRGQHYRWEYNIDVLGQEFFFGVEYETTGFRMKTIKIVVRKETAHVSGNYPMFGDFIILKDGKLTFQYRNSNNGKHVQLQWKMQMNAFSQSFIQKYLPDYSAEESILQVEARGTRGRNTGVISASTNTLSSASPDPLVKDRSKGGRKKKNR